MSGEVDRGCHYDSGVAPRRKNTWLDNVVFFLILAVGSEVVRSFLDQFDTFDEPGLRAGAAFLFLWFLVTMLAAFPWIKARDWWIRKYPPPKSDRTAQWISSVETRRKHPQPTVDAGWHTDPTGRFDWRWWDGTNWTNSVSRGGAQQTDELYNATTGPPRSHRHESERHAARLSAPRRARPDSPAQIPTSPSSRA